MENFVVFCFFFQSGKMTPTKFCNFNNANLQQIWDFVLEMTVERIQQTIWNLYLLGN